MSEPKRPRVDEPEQQDEQQVAELDEPDSLAEGDPAAEGDGLEGDGLEEMDPLTQAYEEAQSLQQALETVRAAGGLAGRALTRHCGSAAVTAMLRC